MTAEAIGLHQLLSIAASATDREGIAFLILTGAYIGFLPDHYAATWVDKGLMTALDPGRLYFDSKIAIAMRKGRRQNLILERFLNELHLTDSAS
ncbi:hypothetical protein D9M71_709710 [compost metagenome]